MSNASNWLSGSRGRLAVIRCGPNRSDQESGVDIYVEGRLSERALRLCGIFRSLHRRVNYQQVDNAGKPVIAVWTNAPLEEITLAVLDNFEDFLCIRESHASAVTLFTADGHSLQMSRRAFEKLLEGQEEGDHGQAA